VLLPNGKELALFSPVRQARNSHKLHTHLKIKFSKTLLIERLITRADYGSNYKVYPKDHI
jgi:hypothetical protein